MSTVGRLDRTVSVYKNVASRAIAMVLILDGNSEVGAHIRSNL